MERTQRGAQGESTGPSQGPLAFPAAGDADQSLIGRAVWQGPAGEGPTRWADSSNSVHQVPLRRSRANAPKSFESSCSIGDDISSTHSGSAVSAAPAASSWDRAKSRSCLPSYCRTAYSTKGSISDLGSLCSSGSSRGPVGPNPSCSVYAHGDESPSTTSCWSGFASDSTIVSRGAAPVAPRQYAAAAAAQSSSCTSAGGTAAASSPRREAKAPANGRGFGQSVAAASAASTSVDITASPVASGTRGAAATAAVERPAGAPGRRHRHVVVFEGYRAPFVAVDEGRPSAAAAAAAVLPTSPAAAAPTLTSAASSAGGGRPASSGKDVDPLLHRVPARDVPRDSSSFTSFASYALEGVTGLAQRVSSNAPVLLQSSKAAAAAAAAATKAIAVAAAAAAAAASVAAAEEPLPGKGCSSFERNTRGRRCSSASSYDVARCSSRSSSRSSCRSSSVANGWEDGAGQTGQTPARGTLISCISSLQPPSPVSAVGVAALAASSPLVFSAVAAHGAVRPAFSSFASAGRETHGNSDPDEGSDELGLRLPPSPRTLKRKETDPRKETAAAGPTDRRIQFAASSGSAENAGMGLTPQPQQQQRTMAQMLPVISSPSYAFLDAKSLGDLLSLPSPSQTTLRVRVWRFRGLLPPRWLEEDLLLHQNLLLFCRSTEPLEVSLLVPLASIASAWAVDGKGRISAAPAAKDRAPYRMKIVAAAGAAAKAVEGETGKKPKGAKTILVGLQSGSERDALLKHILYLADKWRSRPSVPDFLYRPPYQQQLALLRKQLHAATRSLLLSQLATVVREALRRWARNFFLHLRSAAAAESVAAERRAARILQGVLLLQQWLRLCTREAFAWALQRLRLHGLVQQQQQQAAAVVRTLATGHLELATHRMEMARQQIKYAVGRCVERRLHTAFMRLRLFISSSAIKQQTQQNHAQHLNHVLWKPQHQRLQWAFRRLRKAALQRQAQQRALQQLLVRMRQRRLKLCWQQLLLHTSNQRMLARAGNRKAAFLVSLCVNARMRSCLRVLQRHALAVAMEEKLRVCKNIQKVNERLLVSMSQVPRQRGMMLLGSSLQLLLQQRISWAFRTWRAGLHKQKQRIRAALLLLMVLQMKQHRIMHGALVSLQSHVHNDRELYRQKMRAAWLLGLLLREQQLQGLRFAWLCLLRPPPPDACQTAMRRIAAVFERAKFRELRGGFLKLQQMQAMGQTMRCFLRAHLLQQLASRLQMQLLKQQALGFSALRSHAAVIAACKATAEATAEHAALRNRSFLETESPIRVSAATAAAASTRLQHLLDMSSALLDNQQQHSLLLETASCQKPLLYLPQPFPASHAAGAAGAAAASEAADLYAMRAHPSLLSQETCDDEEDFLLPSGGHQPTLLHRGARRGYCCIGAARNPADDAFDLETPFGFSGTSPLAASRTSEEHSAGPSPQHTQLVPPAVTLSHERSNISNNFLSSCKVLDCPDYAAQEGELDSLLRRLQHTDSQICAVARHASRESQPPHQPQREALQQEGGVHAVRGRQPATPEHRVTRGVPMRSPAMQMPCYSSCPTALDSPLSPDATSCRGYRTIALPPH